MEMLCQVTSATLEDLVLIQLYVARRFASNTLQGPFDWDGTGFTLCQACSFFPKAWFPYLRKRGRRVPVASQSR